MMKKTSLTLAIFLVSIFIQAQDTVKVFVALWDSPPKTDLYWGMKYGMNTYFSQDEDWEKVQTSKPGNSIQEQLLFYNKELDLYVEAYAYESSQIKKTITEFIEYAYQADDDELVIYVGHDGLMDFNIDVVPQENSCDAMVFSCVSQSYFEPYLDMILSTYTFMAPEAYGVMAAIESWAKNESEEKIRQKTAVAYAKYQKIAVQSAEHTFIN